jgi:hypothetical protein
LSPTPRHSCPTCAMSRSTSWPKPTTANFFRLFQKAAHEDSDPGLRDLVRRTSDRE